MSRNRSVTPDGVEYRDLNGNGVLDPYEDPRLSHEERVADLVSRLSLAEKAGLLFHPILGVGDPGAHDVPAGISPFTSRDTPGGHATPISKWCDTIRAPGRSSRFSFGISRALSDGRRKSVTTVAVRMSASNKSS